MISLRPEELERMCKELDSYYHDADAALSADQIQTSSEAAGLASTIGEAHTILTAILQDEKKLGTNTERVARMEHLSEIGARLHGRAQKLSNSLG